MDAAGIPTKFLLVWAEGASSSYVTTPVPVPTQTGPNVFRASQQVGFPSGTFTDPAAGGKWPDGRDVNGVLNMISANDQWTQAGGRWAYDSTFQTSIGGYPAGAIVPSAITQGRVWISTVDNNMSNPDTGGSGWLQWGSYGIITFGAAGSYSQTVPPYSNSVWIDCRGGGGAGLCNAGAGPGASGSAGGYSGGWYSVTPGAVLTVIVGLGDQGAGFGGTSSVTAGATLLLQATGGLGLRVGASPGGAGSGGQINMQGGCSTDLDGNTCFCANGGSAPMGGQGGTLNSANTGVAPTWPGGGGGANSSASTNQNGADGGVVFKFRIGS